MPSPLGVRGAPLITPTFVQGPATSPRATTSPSRSWRSPRARSCPLPSPRCVFGGLGGCWGPPGVVALLTPPPALGRCPSATGSAPERNRSAKPSRAAARRRPGRWGGPGVPGLGQGVGPGTPEGQGQALILGGYSGVPSWPCQGTAPPCLSPCSPGDLGCSGGLCRPGRVRGLTLCPPGHVQAGAAADPRRHPHHHPQIQEHPVRHLQTRRLQEPRVRHLHRLWGGQGGLGELPGGQLLARGWPW